MKISFKTRVVVSSLVLCLCAWIALKSVRSSASTAAIFAPSITVTNAVDDVAGTDDGDADPGDTLEYTVTITNNAAVGAGNDASGLNFSDTLDSNLTLVPGTLNASPVAGNDSYETVGNTQLQVAASQTVSPSIFVNGNVLSNDSDPGGSAPTAVAQTNAATTQGGLVTLQTNGTFVYTPPANFTGTDTFNYQATDGTANGTGTVSINVIGMVRYVKNDAVAGGDGRSNTPFNSLAAGQSATAGLTIYVFAGNGTTTNQANGITLAANQRLIGSGVALTVPGITVNGTANPTILTAGSAPSITNTAGGNGVSVTAAGDEIRGLIIGGQQNAIDATFSGATTGSLVIANNTITGVTLEGIDINGGSTGTINLSIDNNPVTSTSTGIDIARTAGTVRVTSFSNNPISGNTGGTGVLMNAVILDSDAVTAGFQTLNAGNLVIGQSGNGVGGAGLNLIGVTGDISFTDLDIFADNGSALSATSSGTFNAGSGTGFRIIVGSGVATVSSTNGAGVSISDATIDLQLSALTSTNSTTSGVSLTNVAGTFSAPTGSSITNATASDVALSGGSPAFTYGGTITDDLGSLVSIANQTGGTKSFTGAITDGNDGDGNGISLISNTGATISFSGGLTLSTGTNAAFTATGGGTITATQNNTTIVNTIATTTAAALTVQNTTIGPSGLTFRSIASNGGTSNGITLSTTGSGPFTITGTGTTGSGGTIQNKNGTDGQAATNGSGIYLDNLSGAISLTRMDIEGCQNYGIRGISVSGGLTIDNTTVGTVTKNGTNATIEPEPVTALPGEMSLRFTNLTGTVNFTNDSFDRGFARTLFIHNSTVGSTLTLNISNSTLRESLNNSNGGDPSGGTSDAMTLQTINNATINVNVSNSHFTSYRQFGILTDSRDTSTMNVDIGSCDFSNDNTGNAGASTSLNFSGSGASGNDVLIKYNVHNNLFRHGSVATGTPTNGGAHIVSGGVSGGVKVDGKILNNTMGVSGVVGSGAGNAADALRLFASGNNAATTRVTGSTHTRYLVQGNTIQRYGEVGIQINARQGNSTIDASVIGNIIREPGTAALGAFGAIWVNSGALGADTNQVNIAIGSATNASDKNTMQDSDPSNATDVFLDKNTCAGCASTLNIYQNGSDAAGATTEAKVRDVIVDDNNATLNLLTGFTNSSNIGFIAGLPPQPTFAPPAFENPVVVTNEIPERDLSLGSTYQYPAEMWASLSPFVETSTDQRSNSTGEVGKLNAGVVGEAAQLGIIAETTEPQIGTSESSGNYLSAIAAIFGEVTEKLSKAISPTVYAQKREVSENVSPESGETVNINGFALPAGTKSTVIKFRATVNNGPYASGLDNINNTANVTNGSTINVNSNVASIALDAAPDLQVTASDGGVTTQPGVVQVYAVSYQNNTAINGQNAAAVRITQTVPNNTTFNATVSGPGWSCADGSPQGTACTVDVGAVNAGASVASVNFAVNVPALLPVGAVQLSDTTSIAENPVAANGTDRVAGNNSSTDTTNIIGNWLGSASSLWETNTNWSNNLVPPLGNNISIPNAVNQPVLATSRTINLLTLNKNLFINSGIVLTANGNVSLGASIVDGLGTLELGTTSAITRTTGQVNSSLTKNFAAPGPLFVMPVGTTGQYSPLDVTMTAGSGSLTVKANPGDVPTTPPGVLTTTQMLKRYWTLTEGGSITANAVFHYLDADVPVTTTESSWSIFRVAGGTPSRFNTDGVTFLVNPAANTFTVNGLETFSDWTAGNPLAPTAAHVRISGRVLTAEGYPIRNARVTVIDQNGVAHNAITNTFGHYYLDDLEVGQTYLMNVTAKQYRFAVRPVSLLSEMSGFDIYAEP
jgi:hypothetical protein